MNSSGLTRPIRQGLPALALALLAGCAHPPPAQTAAPAAAVAKQAAGGGLLAVRVIAMPSPPRMLALALVTEDQPDPVWLQGRLQQGVPGLQADYLFAVPAASWRLRALADAGDDDSAPLAPSTAPSSRPTSAGWCCGGRRVR